MRPRRHAPPVAIGRAAAGAVALLLAGLAAIPATAPLAAQELEGVALDAGGRPIADAPVALHRVGGMGGESVAAERTDAQGRFRFAIDPLDQAVYFVALRHEDRLYIGPPARGADGGVTGYTIRAEPAAEAGAVASALAREGPVPGAGQPRGATATGGDGGAPAVIWLVALLALATAAVFLTTAPAYRVRRRREMVMELAALENELAAGTAGPAGEDRGEVARRRDALRARLEPAI